MASRPCAAGLLCMDITFRHTFGWIRVGQLAVYQMSSTGTAKKDASVGDLAVGQRSCMGQDVGLLCTLSVR